MIPMLKSLQALLQKELPGEDAHKEVIPVNRPLSSEAIKDALYYRESSVAIVLFPKDSELQSVLIKRSVHPGNPHSGQISFPGGKKEEDDPSLEQTARRECFEEVGIELGSEELIGELTPIYIPVSKFKVQPFIFFKPDPGSYTLDPLEVDGVIEFKLSELKSPDIIQYKDIKLSQGFIQKNVPYFDIHGHTVWGATAMILAELRQLLIKI